MLAFGAPPFHAAVNTDCYFSYLVLKPGNTDFFNVYQDTEQLFPWMTVIENLKLRYLGQYMATAAAMTVAAVAAAFIAPLKVSAPGMYLLSAVISTTSAAEVEVPSMTAEAPT